MRLVQRTQEKFTAEITYRMNILTGFPPWLEPGTLVLAEGTAALFRVTSQLEATDKDHPGPVRRGVFCWSWSYWSCWSYTPSGSASL